MTLNAGDWVEIRSKEEILATLDSNGRLDELPFMPQMLNYCGKRFKVFKRAHKTCDTVNWTGGRRLDNAVHLELRCDGAAHGGCQAGCLLYWKEAWLRPVDPDGEASATAGNDAGVSKEALLGATEVGTNDAGQTLYSCQATELTRATKSLLPWWEPSQYVQDVASG